MSIFLRLFGRPRYADRVPDDLWAWTLSEHPIFSGLAPDQLVRLRETTGRFLSTRQFFPVEGVTVDERLKVSISSQACLPILELDLRLYRGWSTLVLTDAEFDVEMHNTDEAGVVHEFDERASGEFLPLGSIILSIPDVNASGWGDGYNVVIHEMAHVLDRSNGALDGAPTLHRDMNQRRWADAFTAAYHDLQHGVSIWEGRRPRSRIDSYAAESPAEFFAVASELFFERPWLLSEEYPEVYEQLSLFYRQDPLRR